MLLDCPGTFRPNLYTFLLGASKSVFFRRCYISLFNQFLVNSHILYPLKTSENQRSFGVFSGYKTEVTLATNGLRRFGYFASIYTKIEKVTNIARKNICILISIFKGILLLWVALHVLSFFISLNPLNANLTKWSNTLKQFVGNLPTNC